MHDAFGMRRVERLGNLRPEIDDAIDLQRTAGDHLGQLLAVEHLHGKEGTSFVLADLVDRADIGMVQARNRARLVLKARETACVDTREELDDDVPAEREIFGAVDDRATAFADFLAHAVVGHRLSGHDHVRPEGQPRARPEGRGRFSRHCLV